MFKDNKDFYPTPLSLAKKMIEKVKFTSEMKILEPSAGKGDLIKVLITAYEKEWKKKHGSYRSSKNFSPDIDVIEQDRNLQHILKGENHRLVADNFLKFDTEKWYDLIIMNPPFSDGVKHVLKAIEMISNGGQLVALLNASNVKRPKTVYEKDLLTKLVQYEAEVEYLEDEFATSETERKTNVEVALIYINVEREEEGKKSILISNLRKSMEEEKLKAGDESIDNGNYYVTSNNFVQSIVEQFQFEIRAGLNLIDEFYAAKKHFLIDFSDKENSNSLLTLKLSSDTTRIYQSPDRKTLRNNYIKELRAKYWRKLFASKEFEKLFTSEVRRIYNEQVSKLVDYDFTLFNICQVEEDLSKTIFESKEEAIGKLFEEFSHKHYYDATSKNIHYYNGWKTNKSWKINKKVIIPLNAYDTWDNQINLLDYKVTEKLNDLTKSLAYLDTAAPFDPEVLQTVLKNAKESNQTSKIETQYFYLTFYRKGTCHIQFKDEDLLKRFNIVGSKLRSWLPPSYGEKKYDEMNSEEKAVIDEFEGEKSYQETLERKEYFLEDISKSNANLPFSQHIQLEYKEENKKDAETIVSPKAETAEIIVKEIPAEESTPVVVNKVDVIESVVKSTELGSEEVVVEPKYLADTLVSNSSIEPLEVVNNTIVSPEFEAAEIIAEEFPVEESTPVIEVVVNEVDVIESVVKSAELGSEEVVVEPKYLADTLDEVLEVVNEPIIETKSNAKNTISESTKLINNAVIKIEGTDNLVLNSSTFELKQKSEVINKSTIASQTNEEKSKIASVFEPLQMSLF